jgi:hypothetical protein
MEIVKIIGIALAALIVIVILRQYKPEFAVYVSIFARDTNPYIFHFSNFRGNKSFERYS